VEFALSKTQNQRLYLPELPEGKEYHLETREHKQLVLEKLFVSIVKKGEEIGEI